MSPQRQSKARVLEIYSLPGEVVTVTAENVSLEAHRPAPQGDYGSKLQIALNADAGCFVDASVKESFGPIEVKGRNTEVLQQLMLHFSGHLCFIPHDIDAFSRLGDRSFIYKDTSGIEHEIYFDQYFALKELFNTLESNGFLNLPPEEVYSKISELHPVVNANPLFDQVWGATLNIVNTGFLDTGLFPFKRGDTVLTTIKENLLDTDSVKYKKWAFPRQKILKAYGLLQYMLYVGYEKSTFENPINLSNSIRRIFSESPGTTIDGYSDVVSQGVKYYPIMEFLPDPVLTSRPYEGKSIHFAKYQVLVEELMSKFYSNLFKDRNMYMDIKERYNPFFDKDTYKEDASFFSQLSHESIVDILHLINPKLLETGFVKKTLSSWDKNEDKGIQTYDELVMYLNDSKKSGNMEEVVRIYGALMVELLQRAYGPLAYMPTKKKAVGLLMKPDAICVTGDARTLKALTSDRYIRPDGDFMNRLMTLYVRQLEGLQQYLMQEEIDNRMNSVVESENVKKSTYEYIANGGAQVIPNFDGSIILNICEIKTGDQKVSMGAEKNMQRIILFLDMAYEATKLPKEEFNEWLRRSDSFYSLMIGTGLLDIRSKVVNAGGGTTGVEFLDGNTNQLRPGKIPSLDKSFFKPKLFEQRVNYENAFDLMTIVNLGLRHDIMYGLINRNEDIANSVYTMPSERFTYIMDD